MTSRARLKRLARLFLVVLFLAFVVVIPFAIWGELLTVGLGIDGVVEWLRSMDWAAATGVGLIISDIFLPIPSTAVMAALGVLYGPFIGGLLSAAGSILAGSIGYWLCRALGPRTAEWLAGREGILEARRLFRRWGFWLIAVSRWLPILPETIAMMSGLIRVRFPRFLAALSCGAVPHGFVFATAGHLGREAPLFVVVICAVAPLGLVALLRYLWVPKRT